MAQKNYDIEIDQGEKFGLYFQFTDNDDNLIDLNNYKKAEMQVRKFAGSDDMLVYLLGTGPTGAGASIIGGGTIGFFQSTSTGGISAGRTGGIYFNASSTGSTHGNSTGGVFVAMDALTTSEMPFGRHFYDLEFINPSNETIKVLKGRFVVNREVTK
tara:strand:+ start:220 stop:690 length:471 start_codon:yes stop_codon:yes gene_type:complete